MISSKIRIVVLLLSILQILVVIAAPSIAQKENSKMLKVGDKAPLFSAACTPGADFNLQDAIGKENIVLFFYPKDNTSVCTAEACAFRDMYESFHKVNAIVVGISSDSIESHKKYAEQYKLPFVLVSDQDNKLRNLYQVPKTMGFIPGRVTYVIDKSGIIRLIFNSQFDAQKHIDQALKMLSNLK